MNTQQHDAAHAEAMARHTTENCEGCTIGRRGLVWLIHECKDRGMREYYRYRIAVEIIDHGVSFGMHHWSVPTLNDTAYAFVDEPIMIGVAS